MCGICGYAFFKFKSHEQKIALALTITHYSHHLDLENWWLQVVASDEGTCDQIGKTSTPLFHLSSTYYHYLHSLLKASAAPSKHCFTNTVLQESVPNYVPPVGLDHAP